MCVKHISMGQNARLKVLARMTVVGTIVAAQNGTTGTRERRWGGPSLAHAPFGDYALNLAMPEPSIGTGGPTWTRTTRSAFQIGYSATSRRSFAFPAPGARCGAIFGSGWRPGSGCHEPSRTPPAGS
jgi:hypothetical protein